MDFFDALRISSSGLSAQRVRMNLISSNLANVNTTRTSEGGPYIRKEPVFAAVSASGSFQDELMSQTRDNKGSMVNVVDIIEDQRPLKLKYDPDHPDADDKGYVALPNINTVEEMVNMISATRSYEANVAAIKATKKMALKALEIGR